MIQRVRFPITFRSPLNRSESDIKSDSRRVDRIFCSCLRGLCLGGLLLLPVATNAAPITVSFPYVGTDLFGLQQITLSFQIDQSGTISLDASTDSGNAAFQAAVDAWDNPAISSTTNQELFGASFSLVSATASATGETITLFENDSGVLAIQGQNSGRIDGGGLPTPKPEALTWLVQNVTHPVYLELLSFDYGNAHPNGQLIVTSTGGSTTYDLPGSSTTGSVDVTADNHRFHANQSIAFSVDNSITEGAGLAGFTFEIQTVSPDVAELTPDGDASNGAFITTTYQGQQVWETTDTRDQLYFDVPNGFEFTPGFPVYVLIEYVDSGVGRLLVEYDSIETELYKDSEVHARSSRVNTGEIVTSYQMLEFPRLDNRQSSDTDFRIVLLSAEVDPNPLQIARVQISNVPFDDERFQYALSRPWLTPYQGEVFDLVTTNTLSGKVMAGYQGWFHVPNDYEDEGWGHWGRDRYGPPTEEWMTIDMWPYLNEYEPDVVHPVGDILHEDGRPAYVFSSNDSSVVDRHFRWMRQHGIDGVYLQRFITENSGRFDFVLNNVMEAASKEGRVWALEYDISSLTLDEDEAFNLITADWTYLVNECGILNDPRYLYENGKPVLFIWGFSVRDHSLTLANRILDWFGTQNLYLIGGVGNQWLNQTEWYGHYQKYDQLLAWQESSLNDLNAQKTQLDSWNMKILPHVWPGFSWHHLKELQYPTQYTARNGGQFYWDRIRNAINCGADQIFLGMYDEYDEGTAIIPMSDRHPNIANDGNTTWGHYIDNEGLDPFYYMLLSGATREVLNGQRSLTTTVPSANTLTPQSYGGRAYSSYLQAVNVENGVQYVVNGDGETTASTLDGYPCRINILGDSYFYFDIDDGLVSSNAEGQAVTIEIEYHDSFADARLRLQYDSTSAPYKDHPTAIDVVNDGNWKIQRWNVEDGFFGGSQNAGADFRISVGSNKQAAIRRVTLYFPDNTVSAQVNGDLKLEMDNNRLRWSEEVDALGWRLFSTDDLDNGTWQEVSPITFTGGEVEATVTPSEDKEFFRLRRIDEQ